MEAARPRRNRHRKKQQQQQQQTAERAPATAASSSLAVVADDAHVQAPLDAAQQRSTRESSSGSASSDNADEHGDDADRMMQDMLAAMEADMAQPSDDAHSAVQPIDKTHDADETKATAPLPVTDSEIAQNEDDLLSFLGAAPMTTDAPYASTERSTAPQLTIEIPGAHKDAMDHSGAQPLHRHASGAAGAQTPSAPAFDVDEEAHSDLAASFQALARASESAMQHPVAPSAPHFPDSDDESAGRECEKPVSTPVQRIAALQCDGLMATGAPESSPFGPRGAATPSAPPAIDLDEEHKPEIPPTTASEDAGAIPSAPSLAAVESVDRSGVNQVGTHHAAPSAPPAIDTTPSTPTELPVASSAPSAPLMPSLSPTAAKTISRTAARASDSDAPVAATPAAAAATATTESTESVSRAVRNSFAKARMLDASRNLYPSVPQRSMSRDSSASPSSFASVAADGRVVAANAHSAAAASVTRIQIKLEPFVNFEMNLMRAEASQKRQELKMQRIESNKGELFSRLERYLFSEYLLHTAASSLEAAKTEVDNLMTKVWKLETKRLSSSQRCGDHVEISQQLEFQTAKLEPLQLAKLKAHLDKLRQLRTVESSLHTFDRALAYFHVEQYLNGLLHEPNLVAFLNKMSATCASPHVSRAASGTASDLDVVPERISFFDTLPAGSTLASTVDHLKYCIDVLVYFEKKVTMLDDKASFGRVPHAFYRGELVWHSPDAASGRSSSGHGMVRKIKCYACGCLNAPMETAQCCTLCDSCSVVLYLPPSSVAMRSPEWYSSVVRFRESLQKWITSCLHALLRTKLLSNMPFVLMHVMYLPRIATEERSWMLRFLQFPRALVATTGAVREAWTEDLVDHYLAMLHLVFHPEKLRRMSVLVSSGPPPGAASSAPSAMNGATETPVAVSPEWVLLENPEVLDRCFLSDDDFVAVVNQFPNAFAFEQLFQCTLDTKKSFSRALTLVLELTQSLRAFQEFEKFPLRIAQLLGELLVNASQISASTASTSRTADAVVYYPTLFDQLFLTALHGLVVSDCNRVAWKSLRCFPFASLSELAKWDVLALLLFNVHSVPPEAKSASGWMQFVQRAVSGSRDDATDSDERRALARETLYDLIATDTENAVYLLHAVAHLAASCAGDRSALVSVAVHELFLAGYTVPACQRALGENGERAAAPISTICLAHPWIISSLISLLFKYHECAATWIHVFETFPVNRWTPMPSDLVHIQEWLLLENTSAPRCALARFLLDHINWEFDVHARSLFTSPWLHRRVALIVAEAFVLYKTRRERASDAASAIVLSGGGAPQKLEVAAITKSIRRALWLEDTFDFPQWCWKLVLKLKFYSPATHEPFLALIDLARDRSCEALTLRRWFANASKPLSATVKRVPFYAPRDAELAQLQTVESGNEQLAQDIAAAHAVIGSGTGAPIHEDASEPSQSESERASGLAATTVAATAAQTTEPIVAYLIGQITTFVLSDRIDRWEPLLVLLKHDLFDAATRVLENVFPVLASFDRLKRSCATPPAPGDNTVERSSELEEPPSDDSIASETSGDPATTPAPAPALDLEVEMCMAGIETLSTSELLQFVGVLFDNAYINSDERSRIEDVLQQGYIGGWESSAKTKVLSKLRFVRECSRYLHPALLPALINESFPRSSTAARTTSALFYGAMSWLSSTLRGSKSDALSPSSASTATAALAMRRSSIAGSASSAAAPASLGMLAVSTEYTASTKALCRLIEREFEYSAGTDALGHTMAFWMRVLLHVPFWFEHRAFRHVLDVLVRCSMAQHYVSKAPSPTAAPPSRRTTKALLFDLVARLEAAFATLCYQLKASQDDPSLRDDPGAPLVVSFLPPTDATALSSIFGAAFDAAQHVGGCSFLAFWALLIETRQELPLFCAMGSLMLKYEPKTMAKVEKWKKAKGKLASELALVGLNTSPTGSPAAPVYSKSYVYGHTTFDSLSQYKLYRWCAYCLEMPEDDVAQVLFWQVFFALYFACAGGSRIFGHYFLEREASHRAKRVHMRKHLQSKLRTMINYCSTQAQVVLTTTSGVGTTVSATASSSASEMKERKYAHFVTLSQLYTAMDAWLEEPDPNVWIKDDELVTLPRHYEVRRLQDVLRLSDALLTPARESFDWSELPLWTALCGFEFSFRQQHAGESDAASGEARGMSSLQLERRPSDLLDEEEFAFVEDASDLRRRHSSFGSAFGDASRSVRPLPLLAEHCGPATLTMLPLVSLAVSEESCVVTPSLALNKPGLKSVAVKFSENLSVLVALDAELMDHVSQLYASKARTVTQSIPCLEGSSCRQPASFRFEFLEWSVDKALLDAAHAIVAQSERCDMKAMLTNMTTWSVLDRHDASATAAMSRTSGGAEHFLKLDGDGAMLVMQILLIDEVVRTLDAELQSVRREEQAARDRRTDAEDEPEASEATEAAAVAPAPPVKQWDRVLDRLHEKGLEWFRLLTDLDTKLSRMVPPLREVLWRAIKQLGASFVCVDERETYSLLELMLDDPSRINLLSDCFYPAGAPTRFVEMFSKLLSASGSAKLSTEEKLVLLRRFDFRKWLAPSPTTTNGSSAAAPSKFDRETVLCIVLADVSAQFPADRSLGRSNASGDSSDKHFGDAVLRFYAEVIHLICAAHLEDHVEKVLHALVGVHDDYRFHSPSASHHASAGVDDGSDATSSLSALPRPVDAKVWDAVVSIPLDAWQHLPFAQLETCVAFFSHHMTTLRWQTALSSASAQTTAAAAAQYPIVHWQQLGVLKSFLDLFTIVCRVAPPAQQWSLITTFFEPLLSTLYQPANTTEGSSISSPWSDHDSLSTGTAVCSCFVAACTELLRKKPAAASPTARPVDASASDNAKLTQIWAFYVNVLIPHAPVHICKHLHQFLTRIAWEHWCLTLEIVQQMRELVQRETQQLAADATASYPFVSWLVRDILCRMTWKSTDAWLAQQGETIASLFLVEFAKLCVELVLDLPHFSPPRPSGPRSRLLPSSTTVLPPYFVNFVKQQSAFWAKWTMAASDLDALLQFTLDAVKAPLLAASESAAVGYREPGAAAAARSSPTAIFPANATPAVMQDGFTRLQLVLRLLAQVTTIHHAGLSRVEAFGRVDRYLRMLYSVFEIDAVGGDFAFVPARVSDPSAWLVVLHSASCTVLYEKLDEIVQLYRSDASDSDNDAVVAQDALTTTLVGVLRFCNLPLVERFFKDEQRRRASGAKGSPTSSVSLSWAKCGNVIFVEIDSLVRDFAASHKALVEARGATPSASRSSGSDKSDDDDSSSGDRASKLVASEAVGNRLGRLLWSFLAFRGGELCCLSACGRAIASVHVMSQVAEKSIEKWIIEDRRGAWSDLVMRLRVPELSEDEFESACLEMGNLMTLQVLFMQQLRKAPVLTEAFAMGMLSKLVAWMGKMTVASKSSLTEMKVLFFAAEVTHFVCHALADTLPPHLKKQMLRQVCAILLAFGHARKQHGIMKAIGMGGSLKHNAEFHVASLTIGVFLRLQTRTSVPLRTDERIPLKVTRTTEKHLRSLEDLLKTKDCFPIGKRMDWMLEFLRNPKRSLADQDEFFVSLFSRLYPSHPWLLAKCTYE